MGYPISSLVRFEQFLDPMKKVASMNFYKPDRRRPQHEMHKSPAGGGPTNRRLNGAGGGGGCTSCGSEALTLK